MNRRLLSLIAASAIVIAACSGAAASPALTDSRLILANTTTSLQNLKSVHFKVAISGSINAAALTGGSSDTSPAPDASTADLDLSGTTLEGDVDVTDSSGQVAVSVPALLALTANVIDVGGIAYIKSSLSGPQYSKLDTSALTGALPLPSLGLGGSPDPAEASAMISAVQAELAKLPAPTKLADETVNGQDCYHVQEKVASSDIPEASGLLGDASGTLTVDLWTQKSDLRPSRVVLLIDAASLGNVSVTVDLTNYDAALTIAAPPADQVSDQPFSIPGLTP
jgi:LppX_LprAFG lipoprotein